ncbi:probable EXG1-exo-beta-1,3-glucanase (I/II), major isoform [Serendipita indica DSM 11827]|uniref:Probable EXG1-exo-beta-1,3-glucanase (I/II), major isoform n=1 Tax=Serendipita indica (strain DSM 11827) TaxID=1109443 RepID=G4T8T8_SERID|nr:probable EXG1-exo-beta-1,3-glucanase (I/II), major isoform [Serendipita indica DSM 11827]
MQSTYSRFTVLLLSTLGLFSVLPGTAQAAPVDSANITKRAPTWGFPYGSTKVRGVNLGGWLVLEPWITPSLFEGTGNNGIVDEWTFCQYQDYNTAHSKLVNHWNTWITYNDFVAIKAAGLNHVRLPIGYWAWDISRGEPYHQGQLAYLNSAVGWARQVGLKVLIDLHGAPGSQNGYDNSGHKVSYPLWHTSSDNIARTNAIIKTLASQFSSQTDVVIGIAPLNEPAGYFGNDVLSVTRQYWYDSYGNIRYPYGTSQQGALIEVIHDAFQPLSYWSGFPPGPFEGVMMDTHYYGIFSQAEVSRTEDQQIQSVCARGRDIGNFYLWTIVGEWSLALTHAQYINGRGVGARYDGSYPGSTYVGSCSGFSGSGATFSQSYKTFLRRFWEAETQAFERGAGWVFWTWKAESSDEWSYSAGLNYGWIPQDPTQKIYGNICGY